MALKIVKKKNPKEIKQDKKIAIVTILGTINGSKAQYTIENELKNLITGGEYKNILPLLIESFKDNKNATIVPIYTKDSLRIQNEVLQNSFNIEKNGIFIDEKNFMHVFSIINDLLDEEIYDEFIIDVSHGFRHLPILTTISMIINNFQDSSKITNILFAKEVKAREEYEIIDLKDYLEIANISFVLNTFDDNYTVANHINSRKYNDLILTLNDFSNDIMALNLTNLNTHSLPNLCNELDKVDDISIKTMALELKENLIQDFQLEDKMYLTFYKISKNLFEKNYILASLSMLYESIRMYLKTIIKNDEQAIVLKIEKYFNDDLYKLGDFFKNLDWKPYDKLKSEKEIISSFEYDKLKESYQRRMITPSLIKEISNTRNDLSHANSKMKFSEIKNNTLSFITRYENQYNLKEKLK